LTDPLVRLTAALADRYRIERELGQGGMATVYLAEDLKHKRKVALKVLKPELAAVLGAERFVQEITTTAALQHPHILPLFDSGTADGFLYYVMPFIDGETLRSKLDRETQLGIEEAVTITVNVADALDYAHRHGVVHRDIKPENILLHEGRPMVADFGIALAVSAAAGGRMTETGLSLGTPHYMSPEQATAEREITARSDVYSLGSVLYEMLTGNPPHTGASAQQIIMKIVTEEAAPVTKLRKSVPPNVAAAVAQAIEKLPADRFESARAFADALGNSAFTSTAGLPMGSAAGVAGVPRRTLTGMVAIAAVLLVAALWGWLRPAPHLETSRQRVVLWQHAAGEFLSPSIDRFATQATIAPDGSSIVFTDSVDGSYRLMQKLRGQRDPTPMSGTEGGLSPFFSPDGKWIGYVTFDGKLKKVPAGGGGSLVLSDSTNVIYPTAAWLDDGTIIFEGVRGELLRVPAIGGKSTVVMADSSNLRLTLPVVAPIAGSRGVLFTGCPGNCSNGSSVYVFDFAADSARLLVADAAGAWHSPTGHLLYTDRAGGLFAAGFDAKRLVLTTGAVPVLEGVTPATFTLSPSGDVLYSVERGAKAQSSLVWVARDGSTAPLDATWTGDFAYPALSPDGKALAVSIRDGTTQLWVWRADGTRQQMTRDGTVSWRPSWTPDGRAVYYVSNAGNAAIGSSMDELDVYRMSVDGSAPPERVVHHAFGLWEAEVSRDGQWLLFRSDEVGGIGHIYGRRLTGDTALVPLLVKETQSNQAALSPDGRWLAYTSITEGGREVYVAPFPSMATSRLISRGGGSEPRWAHSGRELFYKSGDQLMVVPVVPGPTLTLGVPRALFTVSGYASARNRQQYDVAPDDRRFLMIKEPERTAGEVVYVENWFPELKAKVTK